MIHDLELQKVMSVCVLCVWKPLVACEWISCGCDKAASIRVKLPPVLWYMTFK